MKNEQEATYQSLLLIFIELCKIYISSTAVLSRGFIAPRAAKIALSIRIPVLIFPVEPKYAAAAFAPPLTRPLMSEACLPVVFSSDAPVIKPTPMWLKHNSLLWDEHCSGNVR